jgi:hypothetical protein
MAEEDELSRQAKSITDWPKPKLEPLMVWNPTDNRWEIEPQAVVEDPDVLSQHE